ncbi:hypothetical protein BY458DRAFT_489362 [Sporodiniella umbellata]|nr:hypothetical protein BY458DRAFT_489362 [Sporodiniella umbellata]
MNENFLSINSDGLSQPMDAEDQEAGSILMNLAKQANRAQCSVPSEKAVTPYSSLSTGHSLCDSSPRRYLEPHQPKAFKTPGLNRPFPTKSISTKVRRNSIHIHLSYKIHAHKMRTQQHMILLFNAIFGQTKGPDPITLILRI